MSTTPSRAAEALLIEGLTRSDYVGHKLRADAMVMGTIFFFCWIMEFEARLLAGLAMTNLLILVLCRFDYGRKWDRARSASSTSSAPDQHRSA